MKLSLEYLIREPKVTLEKNPVIVLLHGYGSNEADLFSFAINTKHHFRLFEKRKIRTRDLATFPRHVNYLCKCL